MPARLRLTAVTAISVLALVASLRAGDKGQKPLTAAQCERLVEKLVNPGKRPFKRYVDVLPKGYTRDGIREAQMPITDAYNKLSANVEVALPTLAKHVGDDRFSYVYEEVISGVYETATVGSACRRIIVEHVEVYREPVTKYDADGRSNSLWFLEDECGGVDKWWKTRKGRSLTALQLEGIEWAMRQPQPEYFSKQEWDAAKRSLGRMAKQIRDTKKPIQVDHEIRFFSR